MTERLEIVCFGNAIMDVMAPVEEGFLANHTIQKGGMNLIDEARALMLTEALDSPQMIAGGSAANSAVGLACLGSRAGFVGQVRDDQLGQSLVRDLAANQVHFCGQIAEQGPATARSIILVTPDAARSMNTYLGSSVLMGPQHIKADLAADIFYLEGYLFDAPQGPALFEAAARQARHCGAQLALSLSDSWCVERHHAALSRFIEQSVDILFCNEQEFIALAGSLSEAEIAAWQERTAELIITHGAAGAHLYAAGETAFAEARPTGRVIDSTGAGDLFATGYLYGKLRGAALAERGRLAACCAGEIICHIGARPQMDLLQLIEG
jgi:sugar/nucleoside kinase (ribokinase family)